MQAPKEPMALEVALVQGTSGCGYSCACEWGSGSVLSDW